jgi:hypothetical protein
LAPVTTLTERWNGHSWTVIPSPNPTGAKNSHLNAVSCTGAKNCLAVGRSAKTKTSGAALVERWNGAKWSIIATPNPTRTGLGGLSCVTATFCMAVGTQAGDPAGIVTHTLAERWNGAKWSIVPSPNPHVNTIVLDGVSCTSPTNCSAIGYYDVPRLETSDTLVEHWDGKTWKIVASPNAAGGASSLLGVSCPTALSCIAVGEIFEGAGPSGTFAEHWNGKAWSLTPYPPSAGFPSVSCTSPTNCFAVGAPDPNQGEPANAVVDRWNGSNWSLEATPESNNTEDFLTSVSCPTATYCLAIGQSYFFQTNRSAALAEQWNGTTWTIAASP